MGATIIGFPTSGLGPWVGPLVGKATSLEEAIAKADVDRSPGLDPPVPRQDHRHQARRQRDGGSRRAAPPAARHRLHGNRRHAAGRGARRRGGHQPGDGGGRARSRGSSRAAATPTTPRCEIVERVLAGEMNERIARRIEELGGRAMPLNFRTTNVLFGERIDAGRRRRTADRPGPRRHGDARRSDGDRQSVLRRPGAGDSVDVHRRDRAEAQRQRRHGGHGRGPGARGREARLPERRERRAARQERSRLADPFAHRRRKRAS